MTDEELSSPSWQEEAMRQNALLHQALSRADRLEAALRWYEQRVSDCRKITREGDAARNELDRDGGDRARAALKGEQQ